MENRNDIDFLDSYWKEAKRIAKDIKENLPQGCGSEKNPMFLSTNGGAKMYITNFSDLQNTWSPKEIINSLEGKSSKLEKLAEKISWLILNNNAEDVKPMVSKICKTGKFKTGIRCSQTIFTLSKVEIKHLKDYFKI